MRFAKYLTDHGHSDADFAARIGVTRQAIHRFKTGQRIPNRATMAKIVEATGGAVTPDSFFDIASPSPDLKEAV